MAQRYSVGNQGYELCKYNVHAILTNGAHLINSLWERVSVICSQPLIHFYQELDQFDWLPEKYGYQLQLLVDQKQY